MSSQVNKGYDKLKTMYDRLQADERKAFTAFIKAVAQAQGFSLKDLMTAKADDGIECPHCRSMEPKGIVRFGVRRGIQWYRCKDCQRTFLAVAGTFLSWTKKDFQVWKTYLRCILEGYSVRRAAAVCKISRNTAFMWRHKILDALAQYQGSQRYMKGIVEADDTFFSVSYKGGKPMAGKHTSAVRLLASEAPAKKRFACHALLIVAGNCIAKCLRSAALLRKHCKPSSVSGFQRRP